MGKSNRIRENKANAPKTPSAAKRKNKKGMPSWVLTMITIVVTAAILIGVAVSLMAENGVFGRWNTVVKTDNYKVNANMMSYYFHTNYQEFYSQYSSYIGDMLDTSVSLKEQNYSEATETAPAVTWYDYFMDQTVESVKSTLYYCEEADALGVKLEDADLEEIDTAIETLETQAATYGYSVNAYISNMYGPGVHKSDVRKAMTYLALSNKCRSYIQEDLNSKITDERIDEGYADNKKAYNVIDYSSYSFTVTYTDIAKDILGENYTDADLADKKTEVLDAYKAAIKNAKDKAEAIKSDSAVSTDDFLTAILTDSAEKEFDTAYKAKTIADADKEKAAAALKDNKAAIVADIVKEIVKDGKVTAEEKTYGAGVSEAYSKLLTEVKSTAFAKVNAQKASSAVDKAGYAESNEFLTWAFAEERGVGDTNVFHTGDGSSEDDTFEKPSTSTVTVYLMRKTQYPNEVKTRNASFMVFSSQADAEKAIAALAEMESVTLESFEEYAETSTTATGHNTITDYVMGTLGNETFDNWLYDALRLPGALTTTPLALDESSYMVVFYAGEGTETWKATVHSALLSADTETYYSEIAAKYEPTVKVQKSLDNVVEA